jgi:hypothetical protein
VRSVAFVTPTMNRPERHQSLYETFRMQTVPRKRLYVLDESRTPSPFFSKLRDRDVVYVQPRMPPRVGGVTRIGAARNLLNSLTREDVIAHVDDDDLLHPTYGEVMLERLGDADLCKLDVWRALHEPTGVVFEWDTRKMGGWHFAIKGERVERAQVKPGDVPEGFVDAFRVGYGWSYVYPRRTWESTPFPNEGTEDIPWVRELRDKGKRIVFVSDAPHLALHTIHVDPNHPQGGSPHFPQRKVGTAGEPDSGLREEVVGRMIGAMQAMQELPSGQDIRIVPGTTYNVLAKVAKSHSLKAIVARAAGWGVNVKEALDNVAPPAGVETPPSGYRLVRVTATATKPAVMPWKIPSLLSFGDETSVVRAWVGAGAAPHKCTAQSASSIAAQIDPRWRYRQSLAPDAALRCGPVETRTHDVVTPEGRKRIEARYQCGMLLLRCPYTGEQFVFEKSLGMGAHPSTIGPCDVFTVELDVSQAQIPPNTPPTQLPQFFNVPAGLFSGPAFKATFTASGHWIIQNVWPATSPAYTFQSSYPNLPYQAQHPNSFVLPSMNLVSLTIQGNDCSGLLVFCMAGYHWDAAAGRCMPNAHTGTTNAPGGLSMAAKVGIGVASVAVVAAAAYGAHRAGWF